MGLNLAGPDGKPLAEGASQSRPQAMDKFQKFNMIYMIFTLMTSAERRELRKALKLIQPKLDLNYPMGMSEGDIKRDIAKIESEIVPDGENNAVAPDAQGTAEPSVPVQQESDAPVQESPATSA